MASRRWRTTQLCAEPIWPHIYVRGLVSAHSHSKAELSTTPIPLTRAASTDCGECINGSIALPRGATRRGLGGSATTNTRNDAASSLCITNQKFGGDVCAQHASKA